MYQNATHTKQQTIRADPNHEARSYCISHDFGGSATLMETLVHAVSGAANVDVSQVEGIIAEQINPTALNRLFQPTNPQSDNAHGQLSLIAWGHDVTIYGDGRIIISPLSAYR